MAFYRCVGGGSSGEPLYNSSSCVKATNVVVTKSNTWASISIYFSNYEKGKYLLIFDAITGGGKFNYHSGRGDITEIWTYFGTNDSSFVVLLDIAADNTADYYYVGLRGSGSAPTTSGFRYHIVRVE